MRTRTLKLPSGLEVTIAPPGPIARMGNAEARQIAQRAGLTAEMSDEERADRALKLPDEEQRVLALAGFEAVCRWVRSHKLSAYEPPPAGREFVDDVLEAADFEALQIAVEEWKGELQAELDPTTGSPIS